MPNSQLRLYINHSKTLGLDKNLEVAFLPWIILRSENEHHSRAPNSINCQVEFFVQYSFKSVEKSEITFPGDLT